MPAFISPAFDNSTVFKRLQFGIFVQGAVLCRHNRIQAAAATGHSCYPNFSFEETVINRSCSTSHLHPTRTDANQYPAGQANAAAGIRTILPGGLWSWSCTVRIGNRKRRGARMCLLEINQGHAFVKGARMLLECLECGLYLMKVHSSGTKTAQWNLSRRRGGGGVGGGIRGFTGTEATIHLLGFFSTDTIIYFHA